MDKQRHSDAAGRVILATIGLVLTVTGAACGGWWVWLGCTMIVAAAA